MKIALCQMDIAWQDVSANLSKLNGMLAEAVRTGAELTVFPEMCLTGFSMKPDQAALPPDSPQLQELLALTRGYRGVVVAGVAIRRPDGPFNECWMISDGKLIGTYQKVNLFSFAGEHDVYRPGKRLFLLPHEGKQFAPTICYDLRFSELFLKAADKVNGGFIVIANWPSARREQWKALLRARALDTQTYVIGVNRVGAGDNLEYSGESTVFDPAGRLLSDYREDECVIPVELNLDEIPRFRARFPVLADRARLMIALGSLTVETVK